MLIKKVLQIKQKIVETEEKPIDLINKVSKISKKRHDFLLGKMHFLGDDGYQKF